MDEKYAATAAYGCFFVGCLVTKLLDVVVHLLGSHSHHPPEQPSEANESVEDSRKGATSGTKATEDGPGPSFSAVTAETTMDKDGAPASLFGDISVQPLDDLNEEAPAVELQDLEEKEDTAQGADDAEQTADLDEAEVGDGSAPRVASFCCCCCGGCYC